MLSSPKSKLLARITPGFLLEVSELRRGEFAFSTSTTVTMSIYVTQCATGETRNSSTFHTGISIALTDNLCHGIILDTFKKRVFPDDLVREYEDGAAAVADITPKCWDESMLALWTRIQAVSVLGIETAVPLEFSSVTAATNRDSKFENDPFEERFVIISLEKSENAVLQIERASHL